MSEASTKILASASAVIEVMAKVTPDINHLLESNMILVSENFTKIAEAGSNLKKMTLDNDDISSEAVKAEVDKINSSVMNAIMSLQFQDRLSQNLVILENISKELSNSTAQAINLQSGVDLDLSKSILELIKLGEIRNIYIDHLVNAGLISGPEDLDYKQVDEAPSSADEIELF